MTAPIPQNNMMEQRYTPQINLDNAKPKSDNYNPQINEEDKVSVGDKVKDFIGEHPYASQAGVFVGSFALGYGTSRFVRKGKDLLNQGIKQLKVRTGQVGGGIAGFCAGVPLAQMAVPVAASSLGGPAGFAVGLGVLGAATLSGFAIGQFIGEHS